MLPNSTLPPELGYTELRAHARQTAAETRTRQGLGPRVVDDVLLDRVAAILRGGIDV